MMGLSHFGQPLWLVGAAVLLPAVLLLYALFDRLQRRRLNAFSISRETDAAQLAVSRTLLWLKRVVFCLAAVVACVALARPLGSMQMQESEQRGLDIMFAVDTSRSMLTPDVKPDRLTRAKLAVEDLLDHLTGDGVGLVAFAGEAFLEAPVTTDYDAFRETLDALDTRTIALGGTDIASAIRLSESTLQSRGDTQKVLVLVTDGEDLAGEALAAAQAAAKQGLIIFTAGVGTAAGELIPITDAAGSAQFVRDEQGNFVKSHLDSDMLRQIAAATGGVYTPLGQQGQGLVTLYQNKLKGFSQGQHTDRQVAVYAELFQWPLAAAIGLLVLEWLLGASVRKRVRVAKPQAALKPAAAACVVLLALEVVPATPARASAITAQEEYNQGQYSQAQRDYAQLLKADPTQSHLQFNLGAAAYKAGDFTTAAAAFNNALRTGEIPLQQSAYYNLGNALFRQGERGVATDPQATIKTWQQALGAYDTALQIRSTDGDAKYNRDLVQRRLDQLQQQQKKQPDPKDKKNDNKDDKKQQDKQDKSGNPGQQGQNGQQNPQGQPNPQDQQKQPGQQGPQDQKGQPDQRSGQNPPPQNQPGQPNQQPGQDPRNQPGQPNPQQQRPQPAGPTQSDPQQQQTAQQGSQPQQVAAAQDNGKPDQMSRSEAEQLLDAAKGDERHLVLDGPDGKAAARTATPLKDY